MERALLVCLVLGWNAALAATPTPTRTTTDTRVMRSTPTATFQMTDTVSPLAPTTPTPTRTATMPLPTSTPTMPPTSTPTQYTLTPTLPPTPTPSLPPTPTVTPQSTPTVTPQSTPTVTPQSTPTVTPQSTPTVTPQSTPTVTPQSTPTRTVIPPSTPTVTPQPQLATVTVLPPPAPTATVPVGPVPPSTATVPPSCDCLASWSMKGVVYKGCQTNKWVKGPFCAVDDSCPDSQPSGALSGMTSRWKYCTDGLDSSTRCICIEGCTGSGNCEVGNAPCDKAPAPNPGLAAYATCNAKCSCTLIWQWSGLLRVGCSWIVTDEGQGGWCPPSYDECNEGTTKTDEKGNAVRMVRCIVKGDTPPPFTPSPDCMCKAVWTWDGVERKGCSEIEGKQWCEVDRSCSLGTLKPDSHGVDVYVAQCSTDTPSPSGLTPVPPVTPVPTQPKDPCSCQGSWKYKGVTYRGCQTTPDSPSSPWCYVYDSCARAHPADPAKGIEAKYLSCIDGVDSTVECECKGECLNEAVPYCEVANAPCVWTPAADNDAGKAYSTCTPDVCKKCRDSWVWDEVSYTGCATPDHGNGSWCPVDVKCQSGWMPTLADGSKWTVCTDDEVCKCLPSWTHNAVQYSGCQTTPDSPGAPWCVVSPRCPTALLGWDMLTGGYWFVYCSDGVEPTRECKCSGGCKNEAIPHCEVANSPCATAPKPSGDAIAAYASCTPRECECLSSWTHLNIKYQGCATTPDSPSAPWCPVSNECASGLEREDSLGVKSKWRHCSDGLDPTRKCECEGACVNEASPYCPLKDTPCSTSPRPAAGGKGYGVCTPEECSRCKAWWTYEGMPYEGCSANDGVGLWCALSDTSMCATAMTMTDSTGVVIKWAYCTPTAAERKKACSCKPRWEYKGLVLEGCQTTIDSPSRPWCAVSTTACPDAWVHQEGFRAVWCEEGVDPSKECKCKSDCKNDHPTAWCEVANAPCKHVPTPSKGGKGFALCTPTPCKCKESWTWKGSTYKGCAATADSSQDPWCPVVNASECRSAYTATDPVDDNEVAYVHGCSRAAADEDSTKIDLSDAAKMALWLLLIIILVPTLVCCCCLGLLIYCFLKNRKATAGARSVEKPSSWMDMDNTVYTNVELMQSHVSRMSTSQRSPEVVSRDGKVTNAVIHSI